MPGIEARSKKGRSLEKWKEKIPSKKEEGVQSPRPSPDDKLLETFMKALEKIQLPKSRPSKAPYSNN